MTTDLAALRIEPSSLRPSRPPMVMTTGGFYATVTDINTYEDRPMEIVFLLGPGLQVRGTTNAIASIVRRAHPDDTGAIPR